jgi:hypothetical protein
MEAEGSTVAPETPGSIHYRLTFHTLHDPELEESESAARVSPDWETLRAATYVNASAATLVPRPLAAALLKVLPPTLLGVYTDTYDGVSECGYVAVATVQEAVALACQLKADLLAAADREGARWGYMLFEFDVSECYSPVEAHTLDAHVRALGRPEQVHRVDLRPPDGDDDGDVGADVLDAGGPAC